MDQRIVTRNHVQTSGSGEKVIVFAHGLGCDQTVWKNVIPAFVADYRIVLFDYVGSGRSDKSAYSPDRYNSLHGYAQDLIEVSEALQLKNIIFVGHSVSGMIGALAAIKRPELIDKLIMIGASPHYLNEADYHGGFERDDIVELLDMMEINYKEWAKYLAPIAMPNEESPELTAEFESMLNANSPGIARQFAEATFMSDHRTDLPNIPVQTLIIQTKEDAIAPLEVAQYLNEHIPDSELVIMETAKGHNPHISHPAETVRAIKQFIG